MGEALKMHTFSTTQLGKSVAAGLAEAAYGPLRLVSHDRLVGVLLSPRDALSLGVICGHGEGPEECSICGPAGRRKPGCPACGGTGVVVVPEEPLSFDSASTYEPCSKCSQEPEEPGAHGPDAAAAAPGSERPGQGDSPRGTAEDPAGLECLNCGGRLSGRLHGRLRCAGCGYYFEPTAAAGKPEAE